MSMIILFEYLQEHPEFVYMEPQKSAFFDYATTRFDNIAKSIRERLNKKIQNPIIKIIQKKLQQDMFHITMKSLLLILFIILNIVIIITVIFSVKTKNNDENSNDNNYKKRKTI